ncbi:MAG TPA: hypothetical protein VHZ74_07965 [Bryobacteraceae bacterium]|nr:hypothetical protein [Bryobacteraceae bacterium]
MFGWAAKWKERRPDRLTRLARAIESIAESDRKVIDESTRVDDLRAQGALDLHRICSAFVDKVNAKLSDPAILLDPAVFEERNYNDGGLNLFQINLRGRILQIEFGPTDELYEDDDFRRPYVLRGAVRSFNQDLLDHGSIDEQMIFYCPSDHSSSNDARWHFFDGRTHRSGLVAEHYLITEMERLL